MSDKNGAPSGNSSNRDDSDHRHYEQVVEELRMVLSDLGRQPKEAEATGEAFREIKDDIDSTIGHNVEADSIPFDPLKTPKSSEPVASDADFWNGNVLGWQNPPDPDLEDLPLPSATGNFNDPLAGLGEAETDNGFAQDLGLKEDAMDALSMEENPLAEPEKETLLPEDKTDPHTSSYGAVESEALNNWDIPELAETEPVLPEAPMSPLNSIPSVVEPSRQHEDPPMADNPFAPNLDAYIKQEAPATSQESIKPAPPAKEPEPPLVPIPQTIHKKVETAAPDPNLILETTDLKPKGLVQIACIFPEGQEKAGQSFVNKLREMGEKSKNTLNIQAVFVHPWRSDQVDVSAWRKSAVLSGADIMFVLVSRAEVKSLKSLNSGPMGEIASRIIYLEQVPMRPLYADIIVELQRGK